MKEILPLLEKLAAQFGTTTEYLWGALLKQAKIAGVCILIEWIFVLALTGVLIKMSKWFIKLAEEKDWDEICYAIPILFSICLVIVWVLMIGELPNLVAAFFNPEYWALQKVLSFIKK